MERIMTLIPFKKAMTDLNCKRSTLFNYIKNGVFSKQKVDSQTYLYKHEILSHINNKKEQLHKVCSKCGTKKELKFFWPQCAQCQLQENKMRNKKWSSSVKFKICHNRSRKKMRDNLTDWVVIQYIKRQTGLSIKTIRANPMLIEIKRKLIMIEREVNKYKSK
jgi:hypothetical protein